MSGWKEKEYKVDPLKWEEVSQMSAELEAAA